MAGDKVKVCLGKAKSGVRQKFGNISERLNFKMLGAGKLFFSLTICSKR